MKSWRIVGRDARAVTTDVRVVNGHVAPAEDLLALRETVRSISAASCALVRLIGMKHIPTP